MDRPCPFCGGEKISGDYPENPSLKVEWAMCDGCGATGPTVEVGQGYLDAWNARAPLPEGAK